jgi:TPR repeat protein
MALCLFGLLIPYVLANNSGTCEDLFTANNMDAAFLSCTDSANMGDPIAQYNLGLMYMTGQGTPEDFKKQVYWFTKSAEQGNANAQLYIASLYEDGKGKPKDYKQAAYWTKKRQNKVMLMLNFI